MERRIDTLIKKEIFSPIDGYFAKAIALPAENGSLPVLLGYLFAMARQGHLCIRIKENKVTPSPASLTEDKEQIHLLEQEIIEAFHQISSFGYEEITDETKIPSSPICVFRNRVYLHKNWLLEKKFLIEIKRLAQSPLFLVLDPLKDFPVCNGEQRDALQKALISPLSVISGGPGTGKTFTAIQIVRAFFSSLPEEEKKWVRVRLTAPTGKAAALLEKNMMSTLGPLKGVSCGTLHSFLKVGFQEDGYKKSLFADLLLIDESSMLDAKLFVRLLSSLLPGGRVIFMGDKDQLPPVESGGFFADLVELAQEFDIPVTLLQKSVRAEKKGLQDLAEAILNQDLEKIKKSEGVKIVSSLKNGVLKELLENKTQIYFSFSPEESFNPLEALQRMERFRILSPLRKGLFGVDTLNETILQALLYKKSSDETMICPILITENDALRGLMNGDTGILKAKASSLRKGIFSGEDRAYFYSKEGKKELKELSAPILPFFSLAYCLSVHKSQGSEYESVLVILPSGSEKFGREVLYTGITRAKKNITLITEENILRSVLEKSSRKISGLTKEK